MSTPMINAARLHADAQLYDTQWEYNILKIYEAMRCVDPVLQDIADDLKKALAGDAGSSAERYIKCALLALKKARGEA